ncbi:hypothetical protein F0L68_33325 [Solihabitans fulvus]|uniref:Uncharacterized protein n=2 Tax=Solihabitans fulvus TaxID=1892852 RepID=A0A5B2WPC5_9PSEU|nr:hypothetical protein F0L68_33325 [Solihabitans fulvus]
MSEDSASETRDKVVRLLDYEATCPDCGVSVGEEHKFDPDDGGCDIAICIMTGLQRLMCDLDHDCGREKWTGWRPGLTECEEFGWLLAPGWPDIPRLYTEAVWDPQKCRWVKPT